MNRRLGRIAKRFDSQPNLSIPAATSGRAEMEATYRFFANENVTPDRILETHYAKTIERAAQEKKVLLIQDTTELNLTRPNEQVHGAGPMSSVSQFGAFVHPLMAFSTLGIPLGIVWHKSWARTEQRPVVTRLRLALVAAKRRRVSRLANVKWTVPHVLLKLRFVHAAWCFEHRIVLIENCQTSNAKW